MTAVDEDPKEQPLVAHLIELRNRILQSAAAVILVFVVLFSWSNEIYMFVSAPLTAILESDMISTGPMDPLLAPLKLTFMVSLFLCIPYLLHHLWAFISPGLYKHEIRVTFPILVSSVVLFYVGLAFCYFIVLGFLFETFIASAPDNVTVMTDIKAYLDFVLKLFLIFGLMFEIPVATVLVVMSGITTPKDLMLKRPYIIIGCFVVAVPLTPPDPFSLFLMAIPMWMLFELGIVASRLLHKPDEEEEAPESVSSEK